MNLRIRRKTRRVIFLQHAARNQLCDRQIGQQMKDRIRFLALVQAQDEISASVIRRLERIDDVFS